MVEVKGPFRWPRIPLLKMPRSTYEGGGPEKDKETQKVRCSAEGREGEGWGRRRLEVNFPFSFLSQDLTLSLQVSNHFLSENLLRAQVYSLMHFY